MENLGKIRWRARRGMREMDKLMDGYINQHYVLASDDEKKLFSELLEMQDPELYALLVHQSTPENKAIKALINKINPFMAD